MAEHPVLEEAGANVLHNRNDSQSLALSESGLHVRQPPNLSESSIPMAITPFALAGSEITHTNTISSIGSINKGLMSLDRWSQSTVSSKSSLDHHIRDASTIPSYGFYNDQNKANADTPSATDTVSGKMDERNSGVIAETQLQGSYSQQHRETPASAVSPTVPAPDLPKSATSLFYEADYDTFNDGGDMPQYPGAMGTADEDERSFNYTADGRPRRHQSHSQKAMLSKALQKANTAVLLDNAANFEGAMGAYNDACELLQLVMHRSNGGTGEKLKLQEIRDTYMIRVNELQGMELTIHDLGDKALPKRPDSNQSYGDLFQSLDDEDELSSRSMSPLQSGLQPDQSMSQGPTAVTRTQIPPRRQSLLPSPVDDELRLMSTSPASKRHPEHGLFEPAPQIPQTECLRENAHTTDNILHQTLPLVMEHLRGPSNSVANAPMQAQQYSAPSFLGTATEDINRSTSWLDTIDESGPSSPSSMHSQRSSMIRQYEKDGHDEHGTELEFHAALDAAVEAAYNQGLEPTMELGRDASDEDSVLNAHKDVELAKWRVREAGRETAAAIARGWEPQYLSHQDATSHGGDTVSYLDEESEEEERLLEEMTSGYIMDDFEFGLQFKSALPRQSDSSSISRMTGEIPVALNTNTMGLTLPTLMEDGVLPTEEIRTGPAVLLPAIAPADLSTPARHPPSLDLRPNPSVRARRLPGQYPNELVIETSSRGSADSWATQNQFLDPLADLLPRAPRSEPPSSLKDMVIPSSSRHEPGRRDPLEEASTEGGLPQADPGKVLAREDGHNIPPIGRPVEKVSSAPDALRRRNRSLSTLRTRKGSVAGASTDSLGTPPASAFPALDTYRGANAGSSPDLPPPAGITLTADGFLSSGMHLFDVHIHSPTTPGSPNLAVSNAPAPLEPCPESFLLRPFWLMRCIYESITHPSGAYLSTKLFVPCDIWCVKNVKLKAVEEKVSSCDLLTAALLKLAQVNTLDADAVLEEMQSLEGVLDQVQALLSKKLGSDVGVQGAMPSFKTLPTSEDMTSPSEVLPVKASTGTGKSYLTSWRKLRSKNSNSSSTASPLNSKEAAKDNLTISSVPMSSSPRSLHIKRSAMQLRHGSPHFTYMASLARLCDAVQVIDQIAQQVEDPGLKHSSPTLVGLELSTRHAAEFFGFYVCRFVLADIATMLDKFIKRGSEWILT